MPKKRIKLIRVFQLISIIALISLAGILVLLHIATQSKSFNQRAANMRADYTAQQKVMIRHEVERAVTFIHERLSQSEQETQALVKQRVYEAVAVAENIYKKNKLSKTDSEIEQMIVEALRAIRFAQGTGYYFITRSDGTSILFSDRPEMEGSNLLNIQDTNGKYVIRDMIEIASKSKEGFYEYHWTKPAVAGKNHKKISYIKQFDPLDCFIGTGLYVEDIEMQIEADLLATISNIRFGKDGYIFVNRLNGDALVANGNLISGSKKLWEVFAQHQDKTKNLFDQEHAAALKPDGDYIYYSMSKLTDPDKEFPKVSFIYGIPDLQWLVGAGVYLDNVETDIAVLQEKLERLQLAEVQRTVLTTGIVIVCILIFLQLVSNRLKKDLDSFVHYFNQVAYEDKEIDTEQIYFDGLSQVADSANTMLHDKTAALERLRQSEERFRTMAELLPEPIFESNMEQVVTYANLRATELFGFTELDFAKGLSATDIFAPEELPKVVENTAALFQGKKTIHAEYRCIKKDGSSFPARFHVSPIIKNGKPCGVRGIVVDLTEQKRAEEEILQLRKLESVGVLAGGIAHDFNNLLAGLFGNIELAKRFLSDEDKAYKYLESAGLSMEQATGLTQQLLTFAKGGDPIKETLSLASVITDTAKFSLRGSKVKLQFDIDPALWLVAADKGQLSQVISNLVINAKQAMPDGGVITINAGNIERAEGKKVQIVVKDQGVGIAPQHLDKVFDPYFSTKQQGSGLGLASCYSIINKHNGTIIAESQLNRGTMFTITLPAVGYPNEELVSAAADEAVTEGVTDSMRILVLDDEELVQQMCGAMLEEMGHQVAYASDGEKAVKKYRDAIEEEQGYDVVICDLTIPGGMGGKEAAQEIIKLNSEAKIIVSSGYASDPVMAEYRRYGFRGRIAKPYRFAELQKVMRQTLDG